MKIQKNIQDQENIQDEAMDTILSLLIISVKKIFIEAFNKNISTEEAETTISNLGLRVIIKKGK